MGMELNPGDTAWMLAATAFVLFMTPGLALFYGGMVRAKNVLGMLMQNIFAMGLLGVLWAAIAFTLAFGNAGDGGFIGNFDYAWMKDVGPAVSTQPFFADTL
jgi:Amt family ammonium transporter